MTKCKKKMKMLQVQNCSGLWGVSPAGYRQGPHTSPCSLGSQAGSGFGYLVGTAVWLNLTNMSRSFLTTSGFSSDKSLCSLGSSAMLNKPQVLLLVFTQLWKREGNEIHVQISRKAFFKSYCPLCL